MSITSILDFQHSRATADEIVYLSSIQVGRLKDKGIALPEMISMIKRQNCDRALANARA